MQVAESAKAVAEQCDITVAMLADPTAAEAVATGPDGIAAGMKAGQLLAKRKCRHTTQASWSTLTCSCAPMFDTDAGKGYVDVSTVDAGTAQRVAKVHCPAHVLQ